MQGNGERGTRVPEIRFGGFSGEWEEKELGEIGNLKNGMNFDKNAMGHGYPFVNLQDVFGKNVVSDKNLGLAQSTEKQRKEYSLQEGDVLFIRSSVKPEGVGETAIIFRNLEDTTYSGFIIRFRPSIEMSVSFNRFFYSISNIRKQILASATSSANTNINQESLQRLQLVFPTKKEQAKIGDFFQQIDHLISQHQQKHDKLLNIKKALLEKMFPLPGKTEPEIRFKGFSGEWEEIKFLNLLDNQDGIRRGPFGSSIKKDMFVSNSNYVIYEQQNAIYDKYETRYNITKEKYNELIKFRVNSGDFIMSGAGTIGRISRVPQGVKSGIFNQALIRIRINENVLDSEYFLQWMKSNKMQTKLTEANPASAMVNLVPMRELKEWDALLPKKLEQTKIGNFFQQLDRLINQHQTQIQKLNHLKQAFLSKMFV